jgi:hypothetical protein
MGAVDDLASVSAAGLADCGIEAPAALAEALIPLWRSSPKGKYHWADRRSGCQHLPGNRWGSGRDASPPVSDQFPALGFDVPTSQMCRSCAAQIAISPQADAFVAVAAELARAEQWAQAGRSGASDADWSWLQFARWKARQPLKGTRWAEVIKAVRGARWAPTALALRGAIAGKRQEAEAVTRLLAESIGDDPGRSALLERAIRMVETDSGSLEESASVLRISGCRRTPDVLAQMYGRMADNYEQVSPWHLVAGAWRAAKKRGVAVAVDTLAEYFDEKFPHVHDLHALSCCALHDPPYAPGDCVHTWALRTAQAHRRSLIAEWLNRLELAICGLEATHLDSSGVCSHLLCVPGWPLTADGMDAIAYLSQFEVECGPYEIDREHYPGRYSNDWVVVLRVPEWAAAHTAELRAPMRSEPINDEPMQAIRMARSGGVPVVGDEFGTGRRKPSALVTAAREQVLNEATPYGYPAHRRTLAPGSKPPPTYGGGDEWTRHSARHVLDGATFIYGFDDMDLLSQALPEDRRSRIGAVVRVELQTGCGRSYHEDDAHICDVQGIVEAVTKMGDVVFTAEGMRDIVTIPGAYVAALTFS